ncbi:MAG: flagellar basal body P-ring formation chaperone FlgA [Desulfobacterales bacterium]|nr:flagellar basal body P-ring formation chaperone FlgA [Desulfobacterales bacterium]
MTASRLKKALCFIFLFLLWGAPAFCAPQKPAILKASSAALSVEDFFKGLKQPLPPELYPHAKTTLLRAPLPGREQTLASLFIENKLHRLASALPAALHLPQRICIKRTGQSPSGKQLKKMLHKKAQESFHEPLVLERFRVTGTRTFPEGALRLTPTAQGLRIRKNRLELPLQASVNGKPAGRLTLRAQASLLKKVVVTTTPLAQGEPFHPSQLALEERPVSPENTPWFTQTNQLQNRRASRPLKKGAIVAPKDTRAQLAIKRGDAVQITYKKGALHITASGVAAKNGAIGDVIPVTNTRSRKRLTCRITAPRHVTPLF